MPLADFLAILFAVVSLLAIDAQIRAAARFTRLLEDSLDAPRRAEPGLESVDPAGLPGLVARWVARAGVPGDTRVQSVFLRQGAQLRMKPGKPWQPLRCEQRIAIPAPGFAWVAKRRLGGLRFIDVIDAWIAGRGFLRVQLFGSIPVARLSGPVADRSELMRYLAELPWAPDAVLRNPFLRWRGVAADAVEVAVQSGGAMAAVTLFFDDDGDVVRIRADARESLEGGKILRRPWCGFFSEYQEIAGRRVPMRAEVGYEYPDGYSAYWKGRITEYRLE